VTRVLPDGMTLLVGPISGWVGGQTFSGGKKAEVRSLDDGAVGHLLGGSVEQQPTQVQDVDDIAHLTHEGHVVLNEQDAEAAGTDDGTQDLAEGWVFPTGHYEGKLLWIPHP